MSKTLLPMELEMAMSPRPGAMTPTPSRSVQMADVGYNIKIWIFFVCIPCLATITLAMQSGTLVPAARKVMPMMTSGIPRVKPTTVT